MSMPVEIAVPPKPEVVAEQNARVAGLDTLRFICALWVFFGHGAAPQIVESFDRGSRFGLLVRGLYNNLWNGPAAVIVFFVISGFCIHYPFAGTARMPALGTFFARRFVRLLAPLAIAIPIANALGVRLTLFHESILWSLLAELAYYLVYPGLRRLQLRLGSWKWLVIGAYGVAFSLILTNPRAGDYPSYGPYLNWLLGLPCWLLGCVLAERVRRERKSPPAPVAIWRWRFAALGLAWLCSGLRFHSPIGFPWTLNLFAIFAASWIAKEINYRRSTVAPAFLEWAGLWSYSLYLIHGLASVLFYKLSPSLWPWLGPGPRWFVMCAFVLGCSYLFYLLVERPSHFLARWAGEKLRSKPAPAPAQ